MRGLQRQRGMTAISMMVVVAIGTFLVLIALRLFPVYIEHFKVASHLKTLAEESGAARMSDGEIRQTLKKRFDIDDVTNVTRDDIFIERSKDGRTIVAIEYEVRTPALGNVDMVVSFIDEVEAAP